MMSDPNANESTNTELNRMTEEQFAELMSQRPVILIGSGTTTPFLPTAEQLKEAVLEFLFTTANRQPEGKDRPLFETLCRRIREPQITTETLLALLTHRCGVVKGQPRFDVVKFWSAVCATPQYSLISCCLAVLAGNGLIGPILSGCVDQMLSNVAKEFGFTFRIVTDQTLPASLEPDVPYLVTYHGTIDTNAEDVPQSPPVSATGRGLAQPFTPELSQFLTDCLTIGDRPIICVGTRGEDVFDMNPLLGSLDPDVRSRFVWLTPDDAPAFHSFVTDTFPGQQYRANVEELFANYCTRHLPESWRPILRIKEHITTPEVDLFDWKRQLQDVTRTFGVSPGRCEMILKDLKANLPGPFAVLAPELPQLAVSDIPGEHFRLFELPFDSLLVGRSLYHEEEIERQSLAHRRQRAFFNYPRSGCVFALTLEELRRWLVSLIQDAKRAERMKLLPEHLSVCCVGIACAYHYLGSMARGRLSALEDWLTHEVPQLRGVLGTIERDTTNQEIAAARRLALVYFSACERYCWLARELLKPDRDPAELWLVERLVQSEAWIAAAKDNIARSSDRKDLSRTFREAIKFRRNRTGEIHWRKIRELGEDWAAKLLQDTHKADLDEPEQAALNEARSVIEEAEQHLKNHSGPRPGHHPVSHTNGVTDTSRENVGNRS